MSLRYDPPGYGYYIELSFAGGKAIYGHLNGDLPNDILKKFEAEYGVLGENENPFIKWDKYKGNYIDVRKNEKIGYTGNTGYVKGENGGYHLHFNLNLDDPLDGALYYLKNDKGTYDIGYNYSITDSVNPLSRINFVLDGKIISLVGIKGYYEVKAHYSEETKKNIIDEVNEISF